VALVLAAALVYTLAARWKREGALAGLLEKDGKPFEINFLTRSASSDKFLAIYREDLKDVGIALNIIRKDWAAWSKDMDEFNYDMTWAAWSSGLFKDAESMWSSKEAARSGGNNITGFTHPRVDELIEQAKSEFDIRKRHDILRDIDRIITAECPYVLLWNINCTRLLYWDKFGTPPTVLSKFGDEMSALSLWWFDPDSAADLDQAMKTGQHLPARAPVVNFDEVFKP
jgi:microcin C transport system substrate-binding protein